MDKKSARVGSGGGGRVVSVAWISFKYRGLPYEVVPCFARGGQQASPLGRPPKQSKHEGSATGELRPAEVQLAVFPAHSHRLSLLWYLY
jgi:hypothetical protein